MLATRWRGAGGRGLAKATSILSPVRSASGSHQLLSRSLISGHGRHARSRGLTGPTRSRDNDLLVSPGSLSSELSRISGLEVSPCKLELARRLLHSRSFSSLEFPRLLFTNTPPIPHLQSRFPRKTFLFLLSVPILLWYFDVFEVRISPHWDERVFVAFPDNPAASPLHFFADREHVEHIVRHHITFGDENIKDPEIQRLVFEGFPMLSGAWSVGNRGVREDEYAMATHSDGVTKVVEVGKRENKDWWMKGVEERKESGLPETHGCRWISNEPCEDYFAFGTSPGAGGKLWNYWGVFDGHAGRSTAVFLQANLIPTVSYSLSGLNGFGSSDQIAENIKQSFVNLDDHMMARAKNAVFWSPPASAVAIAALEPVMSGSCALLSMFDPETSKLRVACTGDSRAVLGRWDPVEEKYVCKPLSADQTGFNQDEVSRITAEHPDEEGIIDPKTGRLLGIAVTRAFADHRWKWPNDLISRVQENFWGPAPRPQSKSPPYMTAEPVVTETDIVRHDPSSMNGSRSSPKSDFMILASDGLWDNISSENAVALVSDWLESRSRGSGSVRADPSAPPPPSYPISNTLNEGTTVEQGEVKWKAEPQYFVVEDENAAVCLTRNAMGGNRRSLFLGLIGLPKPWSRSAVDDTTVIVVFFDKDKEIPADGKKGASRKDEAGIRPGLLEQFERKEKKWWWPF